MMGCPLGPAGMEYHGRGVPFRRGGSGRNGRMRCTGGGGAFVSPGWSGVEMVGTGVCVV